MNDQRTHIDLFSGIGGFALAANAAGFRTSVFCEQDDYCAKVLRRHWPDVPVIPDIRDFDGTKWRGAALLTGGFPCQPFSQAGQQRGEQDDRALWKEMFRVIKEARPRFVLAENVTGLINMALDDVLSQLEGEGYSTGTVVLPACSLNAPHRRDRVWIMAHAGRFQSGSQEKPKRASNDSARCSGRTYARSQEDVAHADIAGLEGSVSKGIQGKAGKLGGYRNPPELVGDEGEDVANTVSGITQKLKRRESVLGKENKRRAAVGHRYGNDETGRAWLPEPNVGFLADGFPAGLAGGGWWDTEPDIPRVATGVKDRRRKLMALGNAIVPQVAYEILKLI